MSDKKYSAITGFLLSIKNTLVVFGSAALLYLLNHYTEWVPEEYMTVAGFIAGVIGYMIKNKVQFEARQE